MEDLIKRALAWLAQQGWAVIVLGVVLAVVDVALVWGVCAAVDAGCVPGPPLWPGAPWLAWTNGILGGFALVAVNALYALAADTVFERKHRNIGAAIVARAFSPFNALCFSMYDCDLAPDGTFTVVLKLANIGPTDWMIKGGHLRAVRIGGDARVEARAYLPPNGLPLRAGTAELVKFTGGPVQPSRHEAMWSHVALGEDERTSPNRAVDAGIMQIDAVEVPIPPLRYVVSLERWRVAHA